VKGLSVKRHTLGERRLGRKDQGAKGLGVEVLRSKGIFGEEE
jgi:hypothetical protein